jgi:hypothetical protein
MIFFQEKSKKAGKNGWAQRQLIEKKTKRSQLPCGRRNR